MKPAGRFWIAVAAAIALVAFLKQPGAHAQASEAAGQASQQRTPVVNTAYGPVKGFEADGVSSFLGIPFAAPPVGDLRWHPPQPPAPWTDPLDTVQFSNWCAQTRAPGFSLPSATEDCLYLNVLTPSQALADGAASPSKRPVMVWIYGGGLAAGRTNDYDATSLVTKGDIVFVSFNYRVNVFGFFSHPALDSEGHDSGNYGLMDQQFALKWVRDNIARFGGDPDNVTIFGESAGGTSVFNQLASPPAAGLFHKAIIQSGALFGGPFFPSFTGIPKAAAQEQGKQLAADIGCDVDMASVADCLRAASTEAIQTVTKKFGNRYAGSIVVDGTIQPRTVREAIESGNFNRVPVINGSNHDEWTWPVGTTEAATGHILTEDEYPSQLQAVFGDHGAAIAAQYPPGNYSNSTGLAFAVAQTDGLFVCPLLEANRMLARFVPVWGYEFNDRNAPYPFPDASFPYGAAHTLEIRYLFKDYHGAVGTLKPLTEDQEMLSAEMIGYWTRFAWAGDPNKNGSSEWPQYGSGSDDYKSLLPPSSVAIPASTIDADHKCSSFWATLSRPN